jgi:corrinoid protein of di/trimethylamine methyltransferase
MRELLDRLARSVMDGEPEEAEAAAEASLEAGLDPMEAIENGLAAGVKTVGEGFGRGELFLMDLMAAAEAMKAGLQVLQPVLQEAGREVKTLGRILIGTVEGDIHDIGKSITASILFANGFEVIDLGVDVPTQTFIEKALEHKPDIIGLSALMSTTMHAQKDVINQLKNRGLDHIKVIIGGAVVNQEWAEEIGADAWSKDALDSAEKAKKLTEK